MDIRGKAMICRGGWVGRRIDQPVDQIVLRIRREWDEDDVTRVLEPAGM